MTPSTRLDPIVRTAFDRLIDYAGLFPPAKLEMAPALAEYLAARTGPHAWMLGRFIVPASRIAELEASHPTAEPIALSVIVDAAAEARTWFSRAQSVLAQVARVRSESRSMRVEALEVPMPALLSQRDTYDATIGQLAGLAQTAGLRDLPMYVEIPRDERWSSLLAPTMSALVRARMAAKVRCGGVVAQAFPSPEELAAFVHACAAENLPFKATAGLHHPVRHAHEGSGFVMHGFLNLLAASALAKRLDLGDVTAVLAEERADAFRFDEDGLYWRDERVSHDELAATREAGFVGYGSCSFLEPVDDLAALGILPKTE